MKVLLIQTAFIGDVVLTTPLIRAIKDQWPAATIDLIVVKQGADVLENLPGVNIHILNKKKRIQGMRKMLNEFSGMKFDLLLCVHRSARSLLLAKRIKAKRKIAFRSISSVWLGFETVKYPEYSEQTHYADKPMLLLERVTQKRIQTPRPWLVSSDTEKMPAAKYFVVSPFSVWGTKMWPKEKFASAAAEISKATGNVAVLTGGSSELELAAGKVVETEIRKQSGNVLNLVGKTTLGELKGLIEKSEMVLCNDSAAIHIASAFDRPTVAIFGPTVKKWGFFPLSTKQRVLENKNIDCRPCSLHGPKVCPKKHFKCMNDIGVEEVVKAALEVTR